MQPDIKRINDAFASELHPLLLKCKKYLADCTDVDKLETLNIIHNAECAGINFSYHAESDFYPRIEITFKWSEEEVYTPRRALNDLASDAGLSEPQLPFEDYKSGGIYEVSDEFIDEKTGKNTITFKFHADDLNGLIEATKKFYISDKKEPKQKENKDWRNTGPGDKTPFPFN